MSSNFYPDSNFFERLTKCGNESHMDEFINECEALKIDVLKGYKPIFTPFLLLERIGLGGVLKPLQAGPVYKDLVNWIQTYIKAMPNPKTLDAADFKKCQQDVADFLDKMEKIFLSLLRGLPELEINAFLKRMDEEIEKYALSKKAGELVENTLKRLRYSFDDGPNDCMAILIGHLIWSLIAMFPFIKPENISKKEAVEMFDKAEIWFNSLFAFFHEAFTKGKRLGFFRLAENRACVYSKIVAKDPSDPQFARAKAWLDRYKPLRRTDDLCDGELIDFAVLGLDGEKVICFTADNHEDIKNRLSLLKGTLEDAARDVEGWSITFCWGNVHCTTGRGTPLKIVHSFLSQESRDPEPEAAVPNTSK